MACWLGAWALGSRRPARLAALPFNRLCQWASHLATLSLSCLVQLSVIRGVSYGICEDGDVRRRRKRRIRTRRRIALGA